MLKRSVLAVMCVALLPLFGGGCRSYRDVWVTVRDAQTHAPVAGALVELSHQARAVPKYHTAQAYTDDAGQVRLPASTDGPTLLIYMEALGYQSRSFMCRHPALGGPVDWREAPQTRTNMYDVNRLEAKVEDAGFWPWEE